MADINTKIKIGLDAADLEKSFAAMIKKLQTDADKLKVAPGAPKQTLGPGGEALKQSTQTNQALDQRLRQEKAGLTEINRQLAQKEAQVLKIQKLQENSNKSVEREIQLKNQLARAERELEEKRNVARIQQVRHDTAQEAANRTRGIRAPGQPQAGMGAGGGGGIGGFKLPTSIMGALNMLGPVGGAAAAGIGAAATSLKLIQGMESVRRFISEAPLRAREAEASAFNMQGQGGQRLTSILNGGAAEELTFDPQRQQANKAASEAIRNRYSPNISNYSFQGRMAQAVLGRQATGALEHGQFGQAIYAAGGRIGIPGFQENFEANKRKEEGALQESQFQAFKNGPEGKLRTELANQYNATAQRNLEFQRQTGLNTSSFRSQFLGGVNEAGFTNEQGMGMAGSIMGAGGSTRSATGNAALGLQAQRNLDLTNAGSVLGTLSKSMGGADTTKDAFVKILAEGTRVGLDGSQFREENRKFVETAAQIVSQSGTTTGAGAEQLIGELGKFFGDKTNTGIEAGKGAFELYRQTSMATTGPRATMRAAGMLTDPMIKGLNRDSREALFNMPIDQLTPDNPAIIAMAKQAKTTPEQLIEAQNKITSKSANLFKNSDVTRDRLAEVKKRYGVNSGIGFQGPLSPRAYEEINTAMGESNISQIKEHPELGQNQRTASAYSDALSSGDVRKQQQALEDAKRTQLEAKTTGRPEDETNRLQAEASKLSNQLFMSIKDSIVPASTAVKDFATDIDTLVAAIKRGTSAGAAIDAFNLKYPGIGPQTVPSAGAPSSGGGSGH